MESENASEKVLNDYFSTLLGPISANEFCTGMQVYYNYIRFHQGIEGLTWALIA